MKMKRYMFAGIAFCIALPALAATQSGPAADMHAFQGYFFKKFPAVPHDDFVNGPYAMDASMRAQWTDIMQFPPFQFSIDSGKTLFTAAFPDGHHYADCFAKGGIGITGTYPQFNPKSGQVVTLEAAINQCRADHGQPALNMSAGPMADIEAYMASTSDGKPFAVKIPNDPRALADYNAGKEYFYSRRGQLNFSCASCHVQGAGDHLRSDLLAPALGMTASFPLYRSAWGSTGTIIRRFIECNKQVRAVPAKPDSAVYANLEYFLNYMNDGLPVAGPGERP